MSLSDWVLVGVLPLLMLSVLVVFIRLLIGPTFSDRVAALDQMTNLGVGVIAAYAIGTRQAVFLDITTILALISFLATIACARYIQERVSR